MVYSQKLDRCLSVNLPEDGGHGLSEDEFGAALDTAKSSTESVRELYDKGTLPLLQLPEMTADLPSLKEIAGLIAQQSDDVVILGTGGSSLGAQALLALRQPGLLPRLHFPDNLDGHSFTSLLSSLNYRRTTFIAVSKSGSTAETMAQFLAVIGTFQALGLEGEMRERCLVLTEPGDRPLRALAQKFGMPALDHDPGVGGRYSVLTAVGLLPAYLGGLDAKAVRDGAKLVLQQTLSEPDSAPVHGAAITYGLAEKAMRASVFLPYHDRLDRFARWYRQLSAESLGKDGHGFTPIDALGPVDQHSQLQLYLDGPADKMFTVFEGPMAGDGPPIPAELLGDDSLDYLKGKTIGDLARAECRATVETLVENGRPVREMKLDALDERTLGALMMHFMLETIILGAMMQVDPFDQPAVEQGKILAREYLRKT